uniref:Uncharacterized protein n=1 Tax=Acrobeloides nanus TaxID=290746 RepID=A0A914D8S8_9BILA
MVNNLTIGRENLPVEETLSLVQAFKSRSQTVQARTRHCSRRTGYSQLCRCENDQQCSCERIGRDKKLTIVDFSLTKAYKETQCVNFFKTQDRQQPVLRKLKDTTSEKRTEFAKEALRRWKLEENISLVKKEFDELKINLKDFVIFLERASAAVYEYLDAVQWNVEQFSIDLNVKITKNTKIIKPASAGNPLTAVNLEDPFIPDSLNEKIVGDGYNTVEC